MSTSTTEVEIKYINDEMIKPLVGYTIVGGVVDDNMTKGWGQPFPVLVLEKEGKKLYATITADDEWNEGGRIMIDGG